MVLKLGFGLEGGRTLWGDMECKEAMAMAAAAED